MDEIITRFAEIEGELDSRRIGTKIKQMLADRLALIDSQQSMDPLMALGEELNGKIIADYLKKFGVDTCF